MPKPLISATDLMAELADAVPPVVLDVRWSLTGPPGRDDYAAGHIPGAAFLDLDTDLCGSPGIGGRHPLPDLASLPEVLQAAGVRSDGDVVVYDSGDLLAAARTWWTLRWIGHRKVRVLAGGYAAWCEAGGPISTEVPRPVRGDLVAKPGGMPLLTAEGAAELVGRGGVLLDVRAAERFRGEVEPLDKVAGHIPGAVNAPGAPELSSVPDVSAAPEVGAYCGSGVTAARTVLQLHVLGRDDAALYVGSWSHWITDPDRPIATGA